MDFSGIYQIRNTVNGKLYVGCAVNIRQRRNEHTSKLARGVHHCRHLQGSWNKHGPAAFVFEVIEQCEKSELLLCEQEAIDLRRPEYNTERVAGSSLGRMHSAETRAKIAAKALGRKWTDASKAKVSATLTGRKMPEEFCAKLRGNRHAVGLKHTEEWKAANSLRNMGKKRPKDAEYRAKIAATLRGRKASLESRANQSAAQLGKKRGPYRKRPKEYADLSA